MKKLIFVFSFFLVFPTLIFGNDIGLERFIEKHTEFDVYKVVNTDSCDCGEILQGPIVDVYNRSSSKSISSYVNEVVFKMDYEEIKKATSAGFTASIPLPGGGFFGIGADFSQDNYKKLVKLRSSGKLSRFTEEKAEEIFIATINKDVVAAWRQCKDWCINGYGPKVFASCYENKMILSIMWKAPPGSGHKRLKINGIFIENAEFLPPFNKESGRKFRLGHGDSKNVLARRIDDKSGCIFSVDFEGWPDAQGVLCEAPKSAPSLMIHELKFNKRDTNACEKTTITVRPLEIFNRQGDIITTIGEDVGTPIPARCGTYPLNPPMLFFGPDENAYLAKLTFRCETRANPNNCAQSTDGYGSVLFKINREENKWELVSKPPFLATSSGRSPLILEYISD